MLITMNTRPAITAEPKWSTREVRRKQRSHEFQLQSGKQPEAEDEEDQTDAESADGEQGNEQPQDPTAHGEEDTVDDAFWPEGAGKVNAADHRQDVCQHERSQQDAQCETNHCNNPSFAVSRTTSARLHGNRI